MPEALIGRHGELAALARFLDSVVLGTRAAVIEGTSGVGKTALWLAARDDATARGFRVLTARPVEAETAFSFAALGDLLTDVLGPVLPALPTPQRRALSVALLREAPGDQPLEHRAVAVATLTALRVLSQSSPVVVAVDDAQWLDAPTARVLSFLVRRLHAEPVGLLVSRRDGETAELPLALDRALSPERVTRVPVGGLSLGAVHVLLRDRLATVLPRPTLRRVHDVAGG
ncbi:MAG: AAA family ATPase, partial [Nocardioidaceae bacterium]